VEEKSKIDKFRKSTAAHHLTYEYICSHNMNMGTQRHKLLSHYVLISQNLSEYLYESKLNIEMFHLIILSICLSSLPL
jgi:hypothetical protein